MPQVLQPLLPGARAQHAAELGHGRAARGAGRGGVHAARAAPGRVRLVPGGGRRVVQVRPAQVHAVRPRGCGMEERLPCACRFWLGLSGRLIRVPCTGCHAHCRAVAAYQTTPCPRSCMGHGPAACSACGLGHDLVLGSVPFMTAFIESIHCVRSGSVSMFGFAGSSSSVSGLAVEYSIQ